MLIGLFLTVVVGHALVRLLVKARQARRRPRGHVFQSAQFPFMVAVYFALIGLGVGEWSLPLWRVHPAVVAIGLAAYLLSSAIQWRAFRDLGAAYSPDIEVRQEQVLVQKGLYRWIRHPLLSALILEVLGAVLVLNAYVTAAAVLVLFVPVVRRRMKAEESVLVAHFGDSYLRYRKCVGGLFPRLSISHAPLS